MKSKKEYINDNNKVKRWFIVLLIILEVLAIGIVIYFSYINKTSTSIQKTIVFYSRKTSGIIIALIITSIFIRYSNKLMLLDDYEYVSGNKTFSWNPVKVSKSEFKKMLENEEHITKCLIRFDNNIHILSMNESKAFYYDYKKIKSIESLMNVFGNTNKIEILYYKDGNPNTYKELMK